MATTTTDKRRDADLQVALTLAALARPILLRHFRTVVDIDDKADSSPVTVADRAAEAAIRAALAQLRPADGVLGEEMGPDRIDAERVWVIDPIDGTKSFIAGKPLFGCLIGLVEAGKPVLGVIEMAALGETYWGAEGFGAVFNGEVIRARGCDALSAATLCATAPEMFQGDDKPAFDRLAGRAKRTLWGSDCLHYAMIAAGWSDLAVEASLKPYDYVACAAVVEAAGGVAMDWNGQPLTLHSDGRVIMAGSRVLAEQALAALTAA